MTRSTDAMFLLVLVLFMLLADHLQLHGLIMVLVVLCAVPVSLALRVARAFWTASTRP